MNKIERTVIDDSYQTNMRFNSEVEDGKKVSDALDSSGAVQNILHYITSTMLVQESYKSGSSQLYTLNKEKDRDLLYGMKCG